MRERRERERERDRDNGTERNRVSEFDTESSVTRLGDF